MRPGLTCLWQISGRSHVDFDQWIALDLRYIDNWSLGLDVKILIQKSRLCSGVWEPIRRTRAPKRPLTSPLMRLGTRESLATVAMLS